jgi:hypothetical protein
MHLYPEGRLENLIIVNIHATSLSILGRELHRINIIAIEWWYIHIVCTIDILVYVTVLLRVGVWFYTFDSYEWIMNCNVCGRKFSWAKGIFLGGRERNHNANVSIDSLQAGIWARDFTNMNQECKPIYVTFKHWAALYWFKKHRQLLSI